LREAYAHRTQNLLNNLGNSPLAANLAANLSWLGQRIVSFNRDQLQGQGSGLLILDNYYSYDNEEKEFLYFCGLRAQFIIGLQTDENAVEIMPMKMYCTRYQLIKRE
jgi:hypothetical protein